MRWKALGAAVGALALTFSLAGEVPESRASAPAACTESSQQPSYNSDTGVFEIGSAKQLIYLSQNFSSTVSGVSGVTGDWGEQDFVLTADIDLGECNFAPIGESYLNSFQGEFDGLGFTIDGLVSEGSGARGLFGETSGATIKNLELQNVRISSDNSHAGAVAGAAISSTIERIKASGVVSGLQNVGGIAGTFQNVSTGRFLSSNIAVGPSGARDAGGIAGYVGIGASINNSYATGSVKGKDAGSLVGQAGDSTIEYSFGRGAVSGEIQEGGLLATIENPGPTITELFWDSEKTGQSSSAGSQGTPKTTTEMTTASTFSAWNGGNGIASWAEFDSSIDNIWGICGAVNDGYPYLLWEYPSDPCATQTEQESSTTSPSRPSPGADSAATHLDSGVSLGSPAASATILAEGEGLDSGQLFTVTLNPGGRLLSSGTASQTGYFSTQVPLPTDLSPGTYTLSLVTRDRAGNPLVLTERFAIDTAGLFTTPTAEANTAVVEEPTPATDDTSETPSTELTPVDDEPSGTQTSDSNDGNASTPSTTNEDPTAATPADRNGGLVPGWLIVTASIILIGLTAGGVTLAIRRNTTPHSW